MGTDLPSFTYVCDQSLQKYHAHLRNKYQKINPIYTMKILKDSDAALNCFPKGLEFKFPKLDLMGTYLTDTIGPVIPQWILIANLTGRSDSVWDTYSQIS